MTAMSYGVWPTKDLLVKSPEPLGAVSSSAKLGQHAAAGRLVPVCPRPTDLREAWAQCGRWCHARSILSYFHLPGHKGEELTRRQGP